MLKLFSSLFLTFVIFCPLAHSLTIGVPGGKPTIQAGIDAASPGDTVLVQPGRYLETIDFKGKNIVVGSMYLATRDSTFILSTILDGNKNGSVVTFKNGETDKAELCGFTVMGGYTKSVGLQLLSWGGGIYCENANPYLHHLIVDGNFTYYDGGGMHIEKSNSVIEYCVIRNNKATGSGGGIYIESGNNKIRYCIFNNNSMGGLVATYSTVYCYSSLLAYNYSFGLWSSISNINIINCTIADHINDVFRIQDSNVNIINSIFWNNIYPEVSEIDIADNFATQARSHVIIAFSNIRGGKNKIDFINDTLSYENNNIDSEPRFNSDYTLNKYSPCIDVGTTFYQIGDSVIVNIKREEYHGDAPDMGSFESNYIQTGIKSINYSGMELTAFPNPFNATISIAFELSRTLNVNLFVFSITGQKLCELVSGPLPVGKHHYQWNGNDISGRKVSSGIYIVRLNYEMHSLTKRVVFLK